MAAKSEDLPEPTGPTTATRAPSGMRRSTFLTASVEGFRDQPKLQLLRLMAFSVGYKKFSHGSQHYIS